jgi:hypothetical protein
LSYHREEVITKRVIFSIPSPAPMDVLAKAIHAAQLEAAKAKGKTKETLYDDDVKIMACDDRIDIYFETEVKK